jgi:hypothetical protein
LLIFSPLLMAQTNPPVVPEGIHSLANGPETICGITASSAEEFELKVRASPTASYNNETDRYVTYEGPMARTLWAFAKPSNFAYRLATCVRVFDKDGSVMMERQMRCDSTRELCDRAFLEFDELDESNRRRIAGEERG